MEESLLSIIFAFIGNSMMNIGQATQKIGLGRIKPSENIKAKKKSGVLLWVLGTFCISAATFVIMYAVSVGSVSIVGAMAGSGLASLALFSVFVMKEKVTKREIFGIIIILLSAIMIGAFSKESQSTEIHVHILYIMLAVVFAVYSFAWGFFGKKKSGGMIIGGFSGAAGGFVPLFQKVATSGVGADAAFFDLSQFQGLSLKIMQIFINPYSIIWIILSVAAVIILQFSYKKDDAIKIIPVYTTNYILIPVLGGLFAFSERLNLIQSFGILSIIAGVLILTIKKGK